MTMTNLQRLRRWLQECLQLRRVRPPPQGWLCSLARESLVCAEELEKKKVKCGRDQDCNNSWLMKTLTDYRKSSSSSTHRLQKTVSWHSWWVSSYNPRGSDTSPHPMEYALALTSITLHIPEHQNWAKDQYQNSSGILIWMVKRSIHEQSEWPG